MNLQRSGQFGWVLLLGIFTGACAIVPPSRSDPSPRAAIQTRVTNHFAHALLFKPREAGQENSPLEVRLAPLFIREAAPPTATATRDETRASPPVRLVQVASPSILLLNNKWHRQFTYTWADGAQGLRQTLDLKDRPAIWEVLTDSTGARIIYVSQALELQARAEFGAPLPGRKFSIERSLGETPNVIVASVIEDGPVAMGPILYLPRRSQDVAALICRCMPSQFETLLGQEDYELQVLAPPGKNRRGFPPPELPPSLRLPSAF